MDRRGSRRSSVGVNDLPILKMLGLEREKRVAAELLVEKEHQALLQLRNMLISSRNPTKEPAAYQSARPVTERSTSTSSMGNLPRAFSQEFTASVFGDLPSPLQDSLDMQSILSIETSSSSDGSPLSEAKLAIDLHDDRRLMHVLGDTNCQELLEEHGAQLVNAAVTQAATGCLRVLLQLGCNPNQRTPQNPSPILTVVKNGNLSVLQVLIAHHADINVVDRLGYSPLYLAIQAGRRKIVEEILAANPQMDIMTEYDNSVIHVAVLQDNHTLLRMVIVKLRGSCDHEMVCRVLNKKNEDGSTPLHLAATEGYTKCVEVLCACPEVDVSMIDYKGKTAYDLANGDHCQSIIQTKICKEVPVVMATSETDQPKRTVGTVRVMPHHTWAELKALVQDIISSYRNILRGGLGTGMMGNRNTPTYPINIGQAKISRELKDAIELYSDLLFDDLQHIMAERSRKLAKFDINLPGITSTLAGKYQISKEAESEYHDNDNEEEELTDKEDESTNEISPRTTPYEACGEMGVDPLEILVEIEDPVENMVTTSMIPLHVLKDYTQLVSNNKSVMVHGPPETDLQLLTYHVKRCITLTKENIDDELDEIRIPLHSKFTRDDLIGALYDNGLLEAVGEESDSEDGRSRMLPCVIILDGAHKLPSYDLLEDMCILMKTLEKDSRGVWLSLSDQPNSSLDVFASGNYKLKYVSHCIVTRVIHKSGSNLPSSVMDSCSHIWLTDTEEPTVGQILRTLLCRMIHVRKGRSFSRFDSMYQVILWIWQFWILYNHFMDKFDLQHLKIGSSVHLNCPVTSDSPDAVYNWFLDLWNLRLVPKIRESVQDPLFKPSSKKISRSETVRFLLLFLTQRVMQLTCPLYPEGTLTLLKNLYGVGDVQNLTFPPPTPIGNHADQSIKGSPKMMSKFKSSSSVRSTSTPRGAGSGSPRTHYRSMGSLAEESVLATAGNHTKQPQKKSSTGQRPKSGNLFGRSNLRRTLFKGSRTSLYALDEEENKHNKKKKKDKAHKDAIADPNEQKDSQQAMENLLDQLLSSENKRMDEQRAVMSPYTTSTPTSDPSPPLNQSTHHKISISPSESSHGSLEHTSPVLSTLYTSTKGPSTSSADHSFSEEDTWESEVGVGNTGQYVNGAETRKPSIEVIREEQRSRSRSEENVYKRHSSLEDILRPTSEVSLIPHNHTHTAPPPHNHQLSNNSSDVSSSIGSMSTSGGIHHESMPSFGNQEVIQELSQEEETGRGQENGRGGDDSYDEYQPLDEFNSSIVSSISDSRSLSLYSATLGLDINTVPAARRISVPVRMGVASSSAGRRLSSPAMMWEEDIVEM